MRTVLNKYYSLTHWLSFLPKIHVHGYVILLMPKLSVSSYLYYKTLATVA